MIKRKSINSINEFGMRKMKERSRNKKRSGYKRKKERKRRLNRQQLKKKRKNRST
jgi:hypothetical protein